VPLTGSGRVEYLVVGSTMSDRTDALRHLTIVLLTAEPIAILLASGAGWFVAGLGLRPVERMRRQASAITASGLSRRLDVPPTHDELQRLAVTLNDMLARLDTAAADDRQFLERASHELRTPLTALKAELEVAAAGPRTAEALSAALDSASEETDRMARLANDLLVLARTRDGRLPVRREPCAIRPLVDATAAAHQSRAAQHGVALDCDSDVATVKLDAMRIRQALDNLLDNSVRHCQPGGSVRLAARAHASGVTFRVDDDGAGFADVEAERARLASADSSNLGSGGLGLRIAQTVAASHDGELTLANAAGGGASVVLTIPGVE
jgi:signal transduction histidine kinase